MNDFHVHNGATTHKKFIPKKKSSRNQKAKPKIQKMTEKTEIL